MRGAKRDARDREGWCEWLRRMSRLLEVLRELSREKEEP